MLDAGFAIVTKVRPGHDRAVAAEVIGDVRGRRVLIGDDMIVSGGTLAAAANALREAGATEVHAFATHALLTPDAASTIARAELAELAVTDTVALDEKSAPSGLAVVTTAGMLAQTIRAVFESGSVSAVFAGENELF
jgi:ribose-phosphate pyrophosphokinase